MKQVSFPVKPASPTIPGVSFCGKNTVFVFAVPDGTAEAELLLRKDLKEFCGMFRSYGKDSLLLAALAYNVGPYRILGSKKKYTKSTLLKKIEAGIRDFKTDYVQFCRWKGKKIPSIERRRYMEWMLLYAP